MDSGSEALDPSEVRACLAESDRLVVRFLMRSAAFRRLRFLRASAFATQVRWEGPKSLIWPASVSETRPQVSQ